MIQIKPTNPDYWINSRALSFSENDLDDPNRVAVSLVSGSVIKAYKKGLIDYAFDGEPEKWTLKGYSTKLVNPAAHYIYARLSRTDRTALIVFSVKNYNIDGSITTVNEVDGTSTTTDPSADYFYIKIGELTATDSATNPTIDRELTYDSGLLSTDKGKEESNPLNDMWELSKMSTPWLIRAKQWLSSFTVKGFVTLIGGLIFKNGETEKAITDIKRSTDSDEDVPVGDDNIPTTQYTHEYVEGELEKLDDRFLFKIKDDYTPFSLGVGGDITVTGDVKNKDFASGVTNAGYAMFKNGEGHYQAEADVVVARIMSEVYDLLVKNNAVFKGSLSSEEFVSGFIGGKGWSIRMREWENADGEFEKKSLAEFDDLIVRGSMRIYEFIVSQMLGENDNRIFTGMMEVDHYDAADGRIYLKTDGGKLYNPFRTDDVIIVQQYGGAPTEDNGYYVTKQYEFIVTEAGIGNTEDGENRLDWVTFRNFTTSMDGGDLTLIAERDTLVRLDNISDPARKGIIQMMSVGEDTPYMDFVYGAKTDPDNSLKARFGNIGGVYNPLFGWLKEFGAYLTNLYAVGEFRIAHTGEDVADAIEIAKGLFRTNHRQTTYDLTEEDDFFTNASFTNGCEHWVLGEGATSYFLVDDIPQFFNYELYGSEGEFAGIAEHNGRDMLRLSSSTLLQANDLIRKPGTHKVHTGTVENEDGTYTKVYEEIPDTLYLSVRMYCVASGTVEIGFTGEGGVYYENDFHVSRELSAQEDAYEMKVSSAWDGIGDFCIKSSGDVYIDLLSLADKPLDNFMVTTSTAIEQDAQRISLLGKKVNGVEGSVTDLNIEVSSMKGTISSTVSTVSKIENTIATAGWINASDSVRIFAEQVDEQGVAMKADLDVYVKFDPSTGKVVSGIKLGADQVNISADEYIGIINKGETTISASRVDLNGVVTSSMLSESLKNELVDTKELNDAVGVLTTTINTLQTKEDAKAQSDSLESKINGLNDTLVSYDELGVSKAALAGSTLIVGGYLNTDYAKVKTIEATNGFIAGFNIVGNNLTNEGLDNDASVVFMNSATGNVAAIGGNILPSESGAVGVAYFQNHKEDTSRVTTNYGVIVSAAGTGTNVAISIGGGCVEGFAMKNTIVSGTVRSLDRSDYNVLVTSTAACTILLPVMAINDDGHVVRIKRLGSGVVTVMMQNCETVMGGVGRKSPPVMVYDGTKLLKTSESLKLSTAGHSCEFVWARDIQYTIDGVTYYGAWIQYKLPTSW